MENPFIRYIGCRNKKIQDNEINREVYLKQAHTQKLWKLKISVYINTL